MPRLALSTFKVSADYSGYYYMWSPYYHSYCTDHTQIVQMELPRSGEQKTIVLRNITERSYQSNTAVLFTLDLYTITRSKVQIYAVYYVVINYFREVHY